MWIATYIYLECLPILPQLEEAPLACIALAAPGHSSARSVGRAGHWRAGALKEGIRLSRDGRKPTGS